VSQIREICEQGRLEEALLCPGEPVEVYTFGGMIAHVLTYAAHRRTVLTAALAAHGVDVDDDPIRWVAA
jgi:AraC family transcriptional regulator